MPETKREELKSKISGFNNDSEYVAFLAEDGKPIWEKFLIEVSKKGTKRDFAPLLPDEKDDLQKGIKIAYESLERSVPTTEAQNKALQFLAGTAKKRAQTARFLIAAFLMFFGFGLILVTYYGMPSLAKRQYEQASDALGKELAPKFEELEGFTTGDEFVKVRNQVAKLNATLGTVENSLTEFDSLTTKTNDLVQTGLTASEKFTKELKKIDEAGKKIKSIEDKLALKEIATPAKPAAKPNAPNAPPPAKSLGETITELQKMIEGFKTPDEVVKHLENAQKRLSPLEKLRTRWLDREISSSAYQVLVEGPEEGTNWMIVDSESKRLLNSILKLKNEDKDSYGTSVFDDTRLALGKIEIVPLARDGLTNIKQFTTSFSELGAATNSLANSLEDISNTSANFQKAFEPFKKKTDGTASPIATLNRQSSDIVSTVKLVRYIVDDAEESLKNANNAIGNIETAGEELKKITEIQSTIAYRGTAPAIVMLFAIGGMFVVFALSSLLRWLKNLEYENVAMENEKNTRFLTSIASSLITQGIDPTPLLTRLQASGLQESGRESGGKPNGRMPVTVTLTELVDMMRIK